MQQVFEVQGMTCGHCERAVTNAIQSVDANAQVKIDRAAKRVEVETAADRAAVAAAIAEEGYKVA
ncbi:heavy-metal-associated domain-containing protein [Comamonas fluminis]|jgi:copper chaperone|uniref:heavy-metal-associated domain-containing protein n=1 Tax=Comamonas fluminis TaxID=2796366 RepID=UPI001C47E3FB|nr:heavy-metal-associated domain-containing protein [Comamonas fluminis]